ncbi:chondroitin proteoglycan 2-like isoform X1 [Oppia nitens]|uniref:chondroitin proteoglycan 2-like isoform X1 n=1 Tax=Oppia nitens TaxID=1686743 RepID=UPI0023DC1C5D|nr:chondroitin proteoglycan 2-like isoform X1 [Oppia nitens]
MDKLFCLAVFAILVTFSLGAPQASTRAPIPPRSCKGHDPDKYFRDPDNPHIFHECSHGRWVGANYCPGDLVFDEELQTCDRGGDVPTVKCPEDEGLFPYPGNHHKFIECHDGYGWVLVCPGDLVFVPENKTCEYNDWDWTWPTDTTIAPTKPTVAPTEVPTTVKPTVVPTAPPTVKCPEDEGLFPYPGNHHKFIECHRGQAWVLVCPGDLVFVPETKTCVYNDWDWTWPTDATIAPTKPTVGPTEVPTAGKPTVQPSPQPTGAPTGKPVPSVDPSAEPPSFWCRLKNFFGRK